MSLAVQVEPSEVPDSIDQWLRSNSLIQTQRGKVSAERLIPKIPLGILCSQQEDNHEPLELNHLGQVILPNSSWGCRLCQLQFISLDEHHAHYKSESHLMKLKKQNHHPDSEAIDLDPLDETGVTTGDADDADSSSSSDEDEETIALTESNSTVADTHSTSPQEYSEGTFQKIYSNQFGTQFVFRPRSSSWEYRISDMIFGFPHSSSTPSSFSIPSAGSFASASQANPWNILSQTVSSLQQNHLICILILRSGRFAASIFNSSTATSVIHKVFRRYTVRAKAGGSQSSHDSKGRKAQSVGSQLRRYGEQALREDITKLLLSWKDLINASSAILISIPKTMRGYVFHHDLPQDRDYPLKTIDSRVKFISLQVGKPVYEELCAVYEKAMTIYFRISSQSTEEAEEAQHQQRLEQESNSGVPLPQIKEETEAAVSVSGKEEAVSFHLGEEILRVKEACEEGKADQVRELLSHWTNDNHLSDPLSLETLMTLLHLAAENGSPKIVTLLLEAGASPEVKDIRNRCPYHLCKDKETRDAFRRFRGTAETIWNWDSCGVPVGLTEEMIRIQKEKEKEKKKKAKQRKKEEKLTEVSSATQAEGGAVVQEVMTEEKFREGMSQLERRARDQAGMCPACQKSLYGLVTYDIYDQKCCSSACVVMMRRRMAAEAAEKRMANK